MVKLDVKNITVATTWRIESKCKYGAINGVVSIVQEQNLKQLE